MKFPTPARLHDWPRSRKQSISSMPRFGQITQSTLLIVEQWARSQVVSVARGLQRRKVNGNHAVPVTCNSISTRAFTRIHFQRGAFSIWCCDRTARLTLSRRQLIFSRGRAIWTDVKVELSVHKWQYSFFWSRYAMMHILATHFASKLSKCS